MINSTNNLRRNVEILYKQRKFEEILALLTDEELEIQKNAELFAWRARANYRLGYDVAVTMLLAEKAIAIDPTYFMGYFTMALVWSEKNENDKAIADYTIAIELNPDFADAYYNRGIAWQYKKEHDKAIADFEKAIINFSKDIEIDPDYADAYYNRGTSWYNKNEYDRAIADYTKVIEINSNSEIAFYNRGLAWFAKKEYEKAIADYTKSINFNSKYADTYYNELGNAWKAIADYNKAIEYFTKATEIDPNFANAYYGRGLAKKEKNFDPKEIKQDFEKYLELTTIDVNEIWAKYAKYYIEELNEKIEDHNLWSIRQLVNDIKSVLLIKDECVTHYTSFSVLKKLILEKSKFRISEGNFMNDPSEGREFFNFLQYKLYTPHNSDSSSETFSPKPFIGSFVTKDKYDDLNMWRFYGKEDGVEAKGCAITLRTQEFIEEIENVILNEKKEARQDNESDIHFYRVVYIVHDGSTQFYIPNSDKIKELERLMEELKEKVKSYKGNNKSSLEKYLNCIAFLFKSDAYKNENEVRLVVKGIEFKKKYNLDVSPPRVYIELEPIKKIVEQVTLGPKVDKVNEWASAFHYSYEENAPAIIISHLPYK